jgi:hypothetical protein
MSEIKEPGTVRDALEHLGDELKYRSDSALRTTYNTLYLELMEINKDAEQIKQCLENLKTYMSKRRIRIPIIEVP